MIKEMSSKYPGKCQLCYENFPAGTIILWGPTTGATHKECPPKTEKPVQPTPEKLVPGVYELPDGRVYVVKPTRKDKTRLYAKRMVEVGEGVVRATESGERVRAIEFQYERGAIYDIRLSDRMSLDRAKELITLYGCCIACNRHLKAAKSVEQGIGPVCIKNFGPVLTEVEVTTVDGREIVRAA